MPKISIAFSSFEWDRGNVEKNVQKHGVACEEAEAVFFEASGAYLDERHSTESEPRYILLGETPTGRHLLVAFTLRGTRVRIISARPMSRKERSWHEEEKKKDAS